MKSRLRLNNRALFTALYPALLAAGACAEPTISPPPTTTTTEGTTTEVAIGVIHITAMTSGVDLDPDGYAFTVESTEVSLEINGSVTVPTLTGDIPVTISGVRPNCTVAGEPARVIALVDGDSINVSFEISCRALGELTFSTNGAIYNSRGGVESAVRFAPLDATTSMNWASDGLALLFRRGVDDLLIMEEGTSDPVLLTDCHQYGGSGVWSPDEQEVVFGSMPCGSQRFVFTVTNRIGTIQVIVSDTISIAEPVEWTADGSQLLFSGFADQASSDFEVFLANADGSGVTNLTQSPGADTWAVFSADRNRILFTSSRGGGIPNVYSMLTNGSGLVQLTNTSRAEERPTMSPDGSRIAFRSKDRSSGLAQLQIMDADGTGRKIIGDAQQAVGEFVWSPDGSRIAWVIMDPVAGTTKSVYVANADGTDVRDLSGADPNGDGGPAWSPDGERIAFYSKRGGATQVWVVNVKGTGLTQVAAGIDSLFVHDRFAWRPLR